MLLTSLVLWAVRSVGLIVVLLVVASQWVPLQQPSNHQQMKNLTLTAKQSTNKRVLNKRVLTKSKSQSTRVTFTGEPFCKLFVNDSPRIVRTNRSDEVRDVHANVAPWSRRGRNWTTKDAVVRCVAPCSAAGRVLTSCATPFKHQLLNPSIWCRAVTSGAKRTT